MAFTQEQNRVPAAIGDIEVVLFDSDNDVDGVTYNVQVLQADGTIFRVASGNLIPHLTSEQISSLQSFMTTLRAKAVDEFLPE